MNPLFVYSLVYIFACVCAFAITGLVRMLAVRCGALDIPTEPRKIHTRPVPLWGGLAIAIAWYLAIIFAQVTGLMEVGQDHFALLTGFIGAGIILVAGGMADDLYSLAWWQQLAFPIAAALVMMGSGLSISFVTNPFGPGIVNIGSWGIVSSVLLFGWLMGMTYTTKLLDGIDGLATSIALVSALIIFGVSLSWDTQFSPTSFLAIAFAGVLAGFLYWNKFPARIFLGEGGSTLIGFGIAVLAVLSGSKIATALLVMGVPILDVVWILARRLVTGQRIHQADTQHLHFRLLRAGLSQPKIVWLYSGVALAFGSISLFFTTRAKLIGLLVLVVCVILLALYFVHRYGRRNTA